MSSQEIMTKALSLTNTYRTQHGAPPLTWSPLLEKLAGEHAYHLAAKNLPLTAKQDINYGQNLFQLNNETMIKTPVPEMIEMAIKFWYDGNQKYDWTHKGNVGLSFTQLIWAGTTKMGVGVANSSDKKRTVLICFYEPYGNVDGEFTKNVCQKVTAGNIAQFLQSSPSASSRQVSSPGQTIEISRSETSSSHGDNFTQEFSTTSTFSSKTSTSTTSSNIYSDQQNDDQFSDQITSGVGNLQFDHSNSPAKALTSTIVTTGGATSVQRVAQELHNEIRRKHGAGPLKIDEKLCESAKIHAKSLLNGNKAAATLGVAEVGQNVYQITGSLTAKDPSAAVKMAIEKWYEHQKDYNWGAPLASKGYANLFSQLVWKETDSLGVGVASREDLTIIVCLYSPRGNLAQDQIYKDNVSPAK